LEKNRIYNAAFGCILIIISFVSLSAAQDVSPDSSYIIKPEDESADSLRIESKADSLRKITRGIFGEKKADSLFVTPDSLIDDVFPDTADSGHTETLKPTIYYSRIFLAKGIADELKNAPNIFMHSPGPIGSPQIPLHYLNVPGIEITVNDHPFLYNDIYRPYKIGNDLNSVPWEILNDVYWNDERSPDNRLHLNLGRPPDDENRSDIEVFRGPYGYNANRWRFFRPFNEKTYGYFTVGFKKSSGYLQNSDYDGYHVAGGGSRSVLDGNLEIDLWKYKARAGVNSFDFLTPQFYRLSRTTHRYEVSYSREAGSYFDFKISGIYQKNGLIAKELIDALSIDNDIGGGSFSMGKILGENHVDLGVRYYRLRTYKLPGVKPGLNMFQYSGKLSGKFEDFFYRGDVNYAWNGADHGAFLPAAFISYDLTQQIKPFASFSRSRRLPDLNLMYFKDDISGLGLPQILESYIFEPSSDLSFPVTTKLSAGFETGFDWSNWRIMASYMKIKNQIYLFYEIDTIGTNTVSPINFDDGLIEISGNVNIWFGPFDGEIGGSFRQWDERFFSDGLEKGPAAIGFGRISVSKSFFFDDLFLGGSLEFRGASRQDYRSIRVAYLDWFGILNGRLEFRYKNFIFWWNDDNISNNNYTTWWPYPQTPRTVWWGFRWRFYD